MVETGHELCIYINCLVVVLILRMYRLQLLAEVKTTLQHQVTVEYNATATYSSQTRTRTYRLTVAWDTLQTRVLTRPLAEH